MFELTYSSWDIKPFADDVWKEADEDLKEAIKKQWEDNKPIPEAISGTHLNGARWTKKAAQTHPLNGMKSEGYFKSRSSMQSTPNSMDLPPKSFTTY